MSDIESFERVLVIVETAERTFKGYLHRPVAGAADRLSDYLNHYERAFVSLSEVSIHDRGQTHRPGDKREFVAIAVNAITYITPAKSADL